MRIGINTMVDGYLIIDGDLAYPRFGIGSETLKLCNKPKRWEFIDSVAGQTIQFSYRITFFFLLPKK